GGGFRLGPCRKVSRRRGCRHRDRADGGKQGLLQMGILSQVDFDRNYNVTPLMAVTPRPQTQKMELASRVHPGDRPPRPKANKKAGARPAFSICSGVSEDQYFATTGPPQP